MTRHQSFKRLVRTRMAKTGESYTAARATLLAAREPDAGPRPALATSDEMIRQRTGRGWEEWFDLLDGAGLAERPHRDIARWVAELRERSASKPRSARFDWGDGRTRVNVTFQARGEARSTVTVEHTRLRDADAAARMKGWWRERLSALRELHAGRESDA
jgi:hypothetical protein